LDQFADDIVANVERAEGDDSMYSVGAETAHESPDVVFCFGKAVDDDRGMLML